MNLRAIALAGLVAGGCGSDLPTRSPGPDMGEGVRVLTFPPVDDAGCDCIPWPDGMPTLPPKCDHDWCHRD